MTLDSKKVTYWLVGFAILLGLLVVSRPLLVPFALAVLLWAVLNAMTDAFARIRLPRWLAWIASLGVIAALIYAVVRILGSEAADITTQAPVYLKKLELVGQQWLAVLHVHPSPNLADIFNPTNAAPMLGAVASSAGDLVFTSLLVAVYVGFLLAEQRYLPRKLVQITLHSGHRKEGQEVIHAIAQQVQAYLGVCTLLSFAMAAVTFVVLKILGVDFAGFWALVMFLLTYIPTVGAFGVLLPAMMALVQQSSMESFLIVALILGFAHFVLTSVVETVLLGRSLNISPLAIIVGLTFWGEVWGVAGLFLAVPIIGAIAIVCRHIEGLEWVAILLAGPPPKHAHKQLL
ncbi:MAG TPA: AI-2E family transporter [Rhizomicrobium sp.]|nr:AI-2E family transporter [Rhizomicrobium sp.]